MLPPVTDWFPATIDPVHAGWYECRYFDGDIPQRFWFDGFLWRHDPDGEVTRFGNGGADADTESWRGLSHRVTPDLPVARRRRRAPAS